MSEKVADAKVKLSLEDKLTAPLKHLQKKFDTLSKTLSHSLGIPRFSAAVKNMTKSLHGVQSALGVAAKSCFSLYRCLRACWWWSCGKCSRPHHENHASGR
ncbi:hypothetical protein [Bartonella sp. AD24XZML]|uniref:hypothetical protein n=1 Tax=Bartonella sp. AD24XZML TaxID=3243463 RepID=UPI0035CFC2A6